MGKLLPYETIVKAHKGDPDAIDTVLSHYTGYIRYCPKQSEKTFSGRFQWFLAVSTRFYLLFRPL